MFRYLNKNPKNRLVNDCVVRAISLAENKSWEQTYDELSEIAKNEGIILDDVTFVDKYLQDRYIESCQRCNNKRVTIKQFLEENRTGVYLITMKGHITCVINGILYDTWDCSRNKIWSIWKVR